MMKTAGCQWLMPVILAIWEAETEKIMILIYYPSH
jgi:hypothetical protein